MHARNFVITDNQEGDTSESVRRRVLGRLEEEGFAGTSVFIQHPCDWFVIGGRWSGVLSGEPVSPRDSYCDIGYEDDAAILTEPLWDKFVTGGKQYPIEGPQEILWEGVAFIYLDHPYSGLVKESAIGGSKWIVVLDIHY
jgi:hypothetical protein